MYIWHHVQQSSTFDEETICAHLKQIVDEYRYLRDNPARFETQAEYTAFLNTMYALVKETMKVIHAVKRHRQVKEDVGQDINKRIFQESYPRFLPKLSPWSQFLTSGAPALPVARFLPPFPTRPPTDISFPDHRSIKRTSVQALPEATNGIMLAWASEFQRANSMYRQVQSHICEMSQAVLNALTLQQRYPHVAQFQLVSISWTDHRERD